MGPNSPNGEEIKGIFVGMGKENNGVFIMRRSYTNSLPDHEIDMSMMFRDKSIRSYAFYDNGNFVFEKSKSSRRLS